MEWKILESNYLFKDQWLTVRADTCEQPNGKIVAPYYVYEFSDWVTALAITKEGLVVMEKQYRHALNISAMEIPGGCVDHTDPNLEFAIARELREETGYEFENYEYLGKISANPSTNNNWMYMYLATGGVKVGNQQLDHNEDIEVVLCTIDELKQMVRDNKICQAMHLSAIFYALDKLGQLSY